MKEDIFSPSGIYLREQLKGEIDLSNSNLPSLIVPENFIDIDIKLPKEGYPSKIREKIDHIGKDAEELGYPPSIYTAIYDGVLNAHQHGNSLNPQKEIRLSYLLQTDFLEVIVEDQANSLPNQFINFILEMRSRKNLSNSAINWYEFSNTNLSSQSPNKGVGTYFMHIYMDEVKYFKSKELNGLALYMKKANSQ